MKISAGLLIYRETGKGVELLLGHPGGPFWANKDNWSIPKGEVENGEDLKTAAKREFKEETGLHVDTSDALSLGSIKQGNSKVNHVWAVQADVDITRFYCKSYVEVEWPPKSGKTEQFPEIDKIQWFTPEKAKQKLFKYQVEFIDILAKQLGQTIPKPPTQSSLF